MPSDQDLHCINKKANSVDPDQAAWMCQLIWIYTVRPDHKGIYMEERVNLSDTIKEMCHLL
jgi:hypothetical protein